MVRSSLIGLLGGLRVEFRAGLPFIASGDSDDTGARGGSIDSRWY